MLLKSLKRRLLVELVVHKQLRKLETNLFRISNLKRERNNFTVLIIQKQLRKLKPNHRMLTIQLVLEMSVKIKIKPEKLKTNQPFNDENGNFLSMY